MSSFLIWMRIGGKLSLSHWIQNSKNGKKNQFSSCNLSKTYETGVLHLHTLHYRDFLLFFRNVNSIEKCRPELQHHLTMLERGMRWCCSLAWYFSRTLLAKNQMAADMQAFAHALNVSFDCPTLFEGQTILGIKNNYLKNYVALWLE